MVHSARFAFVLTGRGGSVRTNKTDSSLRRLSLHGRLSVLLHNYVSMMDRVVPGF
jgi:hypothetical protein